MEISIQETLAQLIRQLHYYSESPTLDAQVVLAHCLEKPRSWILAHPEVLLNDTQYNIVDQTSARIIDGEPLPYIIGHWEFYGIDFHLTPAVLIPRPETERLVERGINWLRLHPTRRRAVDVGTGSGCIGITLAKTIPDLKILLTDISSEALTVARINTEKYELLGRLEFIQADLLDGVSGLFDMICANLPYIPTPLLTTLPVVKREPRLALDGGQNGTAVFNKLLAQSRYQLAPGGLMLLEIEASQGLVVKNLAETYNPISKVQILKDLSGKDRCVEIELPNSIVHLCQRKEWLEALRRGIFQDRSLLQDGYIHCSRPVQILDVANRFYKGIPDLILLWIDPDRLTSQVRWETADSNLFPHLYGPLNLDAVITVSDLKLEVDGNYRVIQPPV
jgi:release factor glutamine methyltransferase